MNLIKNFSGRISTLLSMSARNRLILAKRSKGTSKGVWEETGVRLRNYRLGFRPEAL